MMTPEQNLAHRASLMRQLQETVERMQELLGIAKGIGNDLQIPFSFDGKLYKPVKPPVMAAPPKDLPSPIPSLAAEMDDYAESTDDYVESDN